MNISKEIQRGTQSKVPFIVLHGWGLRGSTYQKLKELLGKKGYKVYLPDLPGFGNEKLEKTMKLDDYVIFVENFMKKRKLQKAILIGHSFGGRVAVKFASKNRIKVCKLILSGVPIIRHGAIKRKVMFVVSMAGRKALSVFPGEINNFFRKGLYFLIGEFDYYNAGNLKETFKNIINESIIEYAKRIRVQTFLIWGANDSWVSASDVHKIEILIPHSQSVIVSNTGHKLPYEKPELFLRAILSYL